MPDAMSGRTADRHLHQLLPRRRALGLLDRLGAGGRRIPDDACRRGTSSRARNFIDFMDRGVSEAAAVIAVLSRNYLRSRYGRHGVAGRAARRARTTRRQAGHGPAGGLPARGAAVHHHLGRPGRRRRPGPAHVRCCAARSSRRSPGRAKPAGRPGVHSDGPPERTASPARCVPRPGRREAARPRRDPGDAARLPGGPAAHGRAGGGDRAARLRPPLRRAASRAAASRSAPPSCRRAIWADLTRLADAGVPAPTCWS